LGTPLKEKAGDTPEHHLKLAEKAEAGVAVSEAKPSIATEKSNLIAHLYFADARLILPAIGRVLILIKSEPTNAVLP
jgi:hypothetical protein